MSDEPEWDERQASEDAESTPSELGGQVAEALLAAGAIAGKAWKGQPTHPADEERLRAAIHPLVTAGFSAAGRLLKEHKPGAVHRPVTDHAEDLVQPHSRFTTAA